jgi:hypothetical protein
VCQPPQNDARGLTKNITVPPPLTLRLMRASASWVSLKTPTRKKLGKNESNFDRFEEFFNPPQYGNDQV